MMNQSRRIVMTSAMTAALLLPAAALAQAAGVPVDLPPQACSVPAADVVVSFGVNNNNAPPAPHALSPKEAVIQPGGTVTYQMVSAAHRPTIYPVSKDTTSDTIDVQIPGIAAGTTTTLVDGKGDLIIDFAKNPTAGYIEDPVNRFAIALGPQNAAGVPGTLAGPTAGITPPKPGTSLQYRFPTIGRYLVICATRPHFNDKMYGFVNVVNCEPNTPPQAPPNVP